MRKYLKISLLILLAVLLVFISYFFIGKAPESEEIKWGISFSQKHAQALGLDWKETYSALLYDLKAKRIKIGTYWDFIEPQKGEYDFNDLDWQIEQAEKQEAEILLVIGMKTLRWPECHIPEWAVNIGQEEQQKSILNLLKEIVLRYKGRVWAWQVENEPFFTFGECPWKDKEFLKREIDLVKSLDNKPVIISESGEFPLWIKAARYGDIVGVTMYRRVWSKEAGFYINMPFPPVFYWRKAQLIKSIFDKKVICVELQAEPWGPTLLYDSSLDEQEKTMDLEKFKGNIEFARKTGLDEFYLWGAEWWFWMKKQDKPEIWQEAKKLF